MRSPGGHMTGRLYQSHDSIGFRATGNSARQRQRMAGRQQERVMDCQAGGCYACRCCTFYLSCCAAMHMEKENERKGRGDKRELALVCWSAGNIVELSRSLSLSGCFKYFWRPSSFSPVSLLFFFLSSLFIFAASPDFFFFFFLVVRLSLDWGPTIRHHGCRQHLCDCKRRRYRWQSVWFRYLVDVGHSGHQLLQVLLWSAS